MLTIQESLPDTEQEVIIQTNKKAQRCRSEGSMLGSELKLQLFLICQMNVKEIWAGVENC
ncbi:hypothetical protein D4L85_30645 [Chryseolinea soli]|uniref:Uncharacterized protein n=1 Tax=Chryseolinea soli TaxID=2321403 RepID=A0A385T0S7_9BACT|nr:hypothetical protein D4L85_30645 [Chryseolinea soli]